MPNNTILALRRLWRAPVFTLFSIVTLGIAVGATTAIYSLIDAAVLRPPEIRDIERVVNIYHWSPARIAGSPLILLSWDDYQDLRAAQTSFNAIAAWSRFRTTLAARGDAEVTVGEAVEGSFFDLVGVEAALGRTLGAQDDRAGAAPAVVLSDALWRRRFDADPSILGEVVKLGPHAFQVVGVMPARFRGVDMPNLSPTPLWISMTAGEPFGTASSRRGRASRSTAVKARLKPGVDIAAARAEVSAIGEHLDAAYPLSDPSASRYPRPQTDRQWHVMPAADLRVHESVHALTGPLAVTVMTMVVAVLLVACTNLANLLLARGEARRQERAVRLSLGASRWQLVREQLIESGLICAGGALVALALTRLLVARVLDAELFVAPGSRIAIEPNINSSVALAGMVSIGLAFLVFGVFPAIRLTRSNLRDALASDNRSTGVPRWRGRQRLIGLQVAVSVALAATASVFVSQITATVRHDSGIDLDRLAVMQFDFDLQKRDEAAARESLRLIVERAERAVGTGVVALSSGLPFGLSAPSAFVAPGSRPTVLLASTPAIFRVLGVSILRGRAFDEQDNERAPHVAVVSQQAARMFFGEREALGQVMTFKGQPMLGMAEPVSQSATVIGIAANTDVDSRGRRDRAVMYVPFAQHYVPRVSVIARTERDPASVAAGLREVARQTDPELPVIDAGTGLTLAGPPMVPLQMGAALTSVLGVVALLLALAGLFGVLSELVLHRVPEIGVRMALGAGRDRILRLILLDGLRPVLEGLLVGGVLAWGIRRALYPFLNRLLPDADPRALLLVPLLFLAAGAAACYIPARRAASVDPNIALRRS